MAKKKTAKKKTASRKRRSGGVNKSEEIRKYFKANPNASNLDAVAALKKRGISVTASTVATVKSVAKSKAKKGRKKRGAADSAPLDDMKHAGDLMLQAVDLVIKAGAKEAKQLINMADDMVRKISSKK